MIVPAHREDDSAVIALFAGVEHVPSGLPPGLVIQTQARRHRAANMCQVCTTQAAKMPGHRIQHAVVLGGGPQPGRDRGPGRPRHGLHPAPLPQLHRRHAAALLRVSAATTARSRLAWADRCPYNLPAKEVAIASMSRTDSGSADSSTGCPV